jgi:hypothetical protein
MFDYLETLTLALIPGFLLLDFIIQKRRYHKSRHWRLRGLLVTVAIFLFSGEVAAFWRPSAGYQRPGDLRRDYRGCDL